MDKLKIMKPWNSYVVSVCGLDRVSDIRGHPIIFNCKFNA